MKHKTDIYLDELAKRLEATCRKKVSLATISRTLECSGVTFKQVHICSITEVHGCVANMSPLLTSLLK
jgi:hypothetical protein